MYSSRGSALVAAGNYIVVNRPLIRALGNITDALMVGELASLHSLAEVRGEERNGWFECSNDTILDDICVGARGQKSSLDRLGALGIVDVRHVAGNRRAVRIDFDAILDLLDGGTDYGDYEPESPRAEARPDSYEGEMAEIVAYLNERAGTRWTMRTPGVRNHVPARLKEGYTVDDFRTVIDNKVAQWGRDPKMRQFLRPKTLFAPSHFDEYLNQVDGGERTVPHDPTFDKYAGL